MKNVCFSGKGRQLLIYYIIHIMRIRYIRLDHTLYSINYGNSCISYSVYSAMNINCDKRRPQACMIL